MSLTAYVSLTYGTAAVGLLAAAWAAGLPMTGYAPQVYGWFVLLALVPQLVGHSAFNWALRYLPATYVAVTVLGEPIGSIILAVLLLGEVPSPLKLAGSALNVSSDKSFVGSSGRVGSLKSSVAGSVEARFTTMTRSRRFCC